jgi:glycine/D-amino acid oxidase-like deaminating enzyme
LWKNEEFKTIIFCEGSKVIKNPWFKNLPFQPVKGEILTLKIKTNKLPKAIINRGIWIVPYGKNVYKAGSSYNWDDTTVGPTDEVKARLVESLTSFLKVPFEIIDHQTGVRPATTDQHPIIGRHHKDKNIYIFNGFGSKGVLFIPYYAKQLCGHLLFRRKLDAAVDIKRFD